LALTKIPNHIKPALFTTSAEAAERMRGLVEQAMDIWDQLRNVRDHSEYNVLKKSFIQTMDAFKNYRSGWVEFY
jgi:hypothetical protein